MKIIKPSFEILAYSMPFSNGILDGPTMMEQTIEHVGRVCYKSEDKITTDSYKPFIEHLKGLHHDSVLEHGSITVHIVCDRGVSHELVRHRIASYSQESTRYCNYSKDKFNSEITVIEPFFLQSGTLARGIWVNAMHCAERAYNQMLEEGCTPQEARSVLPNSLKTEIVITANPREWRHIFKMRTAKSAHPQMREIMVPILERFKRYWPVLFGDISYE